MNVIEAIEYYLIAYREDLSCVSYLTGKIAETPEGSKKENLKSDLDAAHKSKSYNRYALEQYYLWGITSEKIHKDIQR